jgi:hypothetical protein
MTDETFCFWHSPQTVEDADRARRLGGAHRTKKRTVAAVYGLRGLRTVEDLQTALETVTIETFALENSVSRNRAIASMLATGAKLIEVGEIEERLASLEGARAAAPAAPDPLDDIA